MAGKIEFEDLKDAMGFSLNSLMSFLKTQMDVLPKMMKPMAESLLNDALVTDDMVEGMTKIFHARLAERVNAKEGETRERQTDTV